MGTLIALTAVAALAYACARYLWKDGKRGGCAGCAGCGGDCARCHAAATRSAKSSDGPS